MILNPDNTAGLDVGVTVNGRIIAHPVRVDFFNKLVEYYDDNYSTNTIKGDVSVTLKTRSEDNFAKKQAAHIHDLERLSVEQFETFKFIGESNTPIIILHRPRQWGKTYLVNFLLKHYLAERIEISKELPNEPRQYFIIENAGFMCPEKACYDCIAHLKELGSWLPNSKIIYIETPRV